MKIERTGMAITSVVYVPAAIGYGGYVVSDPALIGLALLISGGAWYVWTLIADSGDNTRVTNVTKSADRVDEDHGDE